MERIFDSNEWIYPEKTSYMKSGGNVGLLLTSMEQTYAKIF